MQLTLSRPKGPAARKKPRRVSAPPDIGQHQSSNKAQRVPAPASKERDAIKILVSSEQQDVIKQDALSGGERMREDKKKMASHGLVVRQPVEQEKPVKTREERARYKSAPEVLLDDGVDPSKERKATKSVFGAGEDMPDGGEMKVRKSLQEGYRRTSLKVCSYT